MSTGSNGLWGDMLSYVNNGYIPDIQFNGVSANSFKLMLGQDGGWKANMSFEVFDGDSKIGDLDVNFTPYKGEDFAGVVIQAAFSSCGPSPSELNWKQITTTDRKSVV